MSDQNQKFESWCIVELFGHARIDVPAVETEASRFNAEKLDYDNYRETVPAFTKLYGPSAIYSITPTSEAIARTVAARLVVRAINPFELPTLRQLAEPGPRDDDEQED